MTRALRLLPALILAVIATFLAHTPAAAQRKNPNILLIVADDLGYADVGIHGSKDIRTPHIDQLAREGVRFTDAYVTGPYCSPTRAGLLTGRYQQRFGHEFNPERQTEAGLPMGERTLADRLKAAGYRTALLGKWHLGTRGSLPPDESRLRRVLRFPGWRPFVPGSRHGSQCDPRR